MLSVGKKINKSSVPIGYVDVIDEPQQLIFLTPVNIDTTIKERKKNKQLALSPIKSIIIEDGFFRPIPPICLFGENAGKMVFRAYVTGPSGCGKSTYVSGLIKEYKFYAPKNRIYVFSDTKSDEVIDQHDPIRISLDYGLVEGEPLEADHFKNSLVIFDDIDSIVVKPIKQAVAALRDQILQKGRHGGVSCIVTMHQITDYLATRVVLNESNSITLFGNSTAAEKVSYVLDNYFGLSKQEIKDVLKLETRWFTVHKDYPRRVDWANGTYLL